MNVNQQVIAAVEGALGVPGRLAGAADDTPLLGAIAELDSMAVAGVLAALEERFGFVIADDEIEGATFTTVGTLVRFVERKLGAT